MKNNVYRVWEVVGVSINDMGTNHVDGIRLRALYDRCGAAIEYVDEDSIRSLFARSRRNRTTVVPG